MWIRFSDIVQPVEIVEKVQALTLDLGYHYDLQVEPVELRFMVQPVPSGHLLEGGFEYAASAPCARCLKPVPFSGKARFNLEYRPARVAPEEEDVEAPEDEPEIVYYEEETLKMEDLVSQQMYLEVPDKLLCKEDCRGLCPSCGADLNERLCGCAPAVDPRWAALNPLPPPEKES